MKRLKNLVYLSILGSICAFLVLLSVAPSPVHAQDMAYIRVIHASPDAGVVDVFVDGNEMLSSFQFGVVTPYVPIPAGGHKIQVGLIGTGLNAPVITQNIMVSAGTPYTVAAVGTKAAGYSLTVFADNNIVSTQNAKVRVYHLSPNASQASILDGSSTIVNGLTYRTASNYIAVSSGVHTFGANIPMSQALSLAANVKPWTVTSLFAIGVVNGTPKIQLVSTQVAGIPGMPGTGSDPNAIVTPQQCYPLGPWVLILMFFLAVMAVCATRHYVTRVRV